jgi:hypothetical protein
MDPEKLKKFIERDLPGFDIVDAPAPEPVDSDLPSKFEIISPAASLEDWRNKPMYSATADREQQNSFLKKFNWKKSPNASEI